MNDGVSRQQLRAERRSLSTAEQQLAGNRLTSNLCRENLFIDAEKIALYLSNDGEIDPAELLTNALSNGKKCFLPALHPTEPNTLCFVAYDVDSPMAPNKFGILEPVFDIAQVASPSSLDVILMPLVGFDRLGNRMGMGGGYYDRTLAFMSEHHSGKPKLVGLAHSSQEVELISQQSWDIPLHVIATDREIICVKQR
jgi:5-formyltetrahydrofolate cyclo-ligase